MYLTSELFHKSTVFRHVNNLHQLLEQDLNFRTTVVVLADNASDWNMKSGVNVLYFGRLFRLVLFVPWLYLVCMNRHSRCFNAYGVPVVKPVHSVQETDQEGGQTLHRHPLLFRALQIQLHRALLGFAFFRILCSCI